MVNLRTLINRRRDLIIISVRSLTFFEGKIVVTALAKLVPLFFQNCTCGFFLTDTSFNPTSVKKRKNLFLFSF